MCCINDIKCIVIFVSRIAIYSRFDIVPECWRNIINPYKTELKRTPTKHLEQKRKKITSFWITRLSSLQPTPNHTTPTFTTANQRYYNNILFALTTNTSASPFCSKSSRVWKNQFLTWESKRSVVSCVWLRPCWFLFLSIEIFNDDASGKNTYNGQQHTDGEQNRPTTRITSANIEV